MHTPPRDRLEDMAHDLRQRHGLTWREARARAREIRALHYRRQSAERYVPGPLALGRVQALVDRRPDLRRLARRAAGCNPHDNAPVRIVGEGPPRQVGTSYYWRWLGRWKSAPGSYVWSTRRVEVGIQWLATIGRDEGGRAHGRALVDSDGTVRTWHHGVLLPDWCDRPTAELLREVDNAEVRAALADYIGQERYIALLGMRPVQADDYGQLYHDGRVAFVRLENATPEPDGTRRIYWLMVPTWVRTAREAVAWTFGMREEEYVLAHES